VRALAVRAIVQAVVVLMASTLLVGTPPPARAASLPPRYSVTFNETGVWPGWSWSLIVNGTTFPEVNNSTTLLLPNGTYNWSVGASQYTPNPANGTLNITGANTTLNIVFTPNRESLGEVAGQFFYDLPIGGNATFQWTIFNGGNPVWVIISVGTSRPDFNMPNVTSPIITVSRRAFALVNYGDSATVTVNLSIPDNPWDAGESWHAILGASANYNGSCPGGSACIVPGVAKIAYGGAFFPYSVNFAEAGLRPGTTWSVSVDGGNVHPSNSSTSSKISVVMPNGTYPFYASATGYSSNAQPGTLVVNGSSVNESVRFGRGTAAVGKNPDGSVYDPHNLGIYVVNYNSSSVSVFGPAANQVVTTIPVGSHPTQVLYDPMNLNLYVVNSRSGNVTIINNTNVVLGTAKVATNPSVATVDPSTGAIYVTCPAKTSPTAKGVVSVIDPKTGGVSNISVGASPGPAVFDPANREMYVANRNSGTISVFNSTGKAATIPVGAAGVAFPVALAFSSQTREMYVAVSSPTPTVDAISSANRIVHRIADPHNPGTLLFDPANHDLYAVDVAGAGNTTNLTVIGANDSVVETLSNLPGPIDPVALYDPVNKRVYVLSPRSDGVAVITSGAIPTLVKTLHTGKQPPVYALVEPVTGTLVVLCSSGTSSLSTVRIYNSNISLIATETVGLGADSLAYQPSTQYTYVTNFGSFTVSTVP
jgi:YVTN family beta-propeller protein